jgi:hypothetical protein
MNDFIQKLLDDIHNINPELSLKRQTEYNQNFINKALNEQCDIHVVVKPFFCNDEKSKDGKCPEQCGVCSEYASR